MKGAQTRFFSLDMTGVSIPKEIRTNPIELQKLLRQRYGKLKADAPGPKTLHTKHCEICGQEYDKRELWRVVYHQQLGHRPIPDA